MRFERFPSSFGTDPDNALTPTLLVYVQQKKGNNDFILNKENM
jgi:hypothetical protein